MESRNSLVSIVLPVWNGEKYLHKSVESILSQTYSNLELIIVNDCSTDSTPSIAEHYSSIDSRVKVIHNKKNQNLPMSLNIGFREALGMYWTWTSDDNIYKSNAIEVMLKHLKSKADLGLVYTDFTIIDDCGQTIGEQKLPPPQNLAISNTVGACFLYTRIAGIETGMYDPKWVLVEDYEYWLRLKSKFNIEKIEGSFYFYRKHPASLTLTKIQRINSTTVALQLSRIKTLTKDLDFNLKVQFIRSILERVNHSNKIPLILRIATKKPALLFPILLMIYRKLTKAINP